MNDLKQKKTAYQFISPFFQLLLYFKLWQKFWRIFEWIFWQIHWRFFWRIFWRIFWRFHDFLMKFLTIFKKLQVLGLEYFRSCMAYNFWSFLHNFSQSVWAWWGRFYDYIGIYDVRRRTTFAQCCHVQNFCKIFAPFSNVNWTPLDHTLNGALFDFQCNLRCNIKAKTMSPKLWAH